MVTRGHGAKANHHPIRLRGLGRVGDEQGPLLIQRIDDNFIDALLHELAAPEGIKTVQQAQVKANADRSVTLYQPVHRVFHLALFEAYCEELGRPRLDPTRIAGAGLVVRRIATDTAGNTLAPERLEGWTSMGTTNTGWRPLDSPRALDQDPDPALRRPLFTTGQAELDRRIVERNGLTTPLAENSSPLFVAPPALCAALGKTILYGLVPVISAEYSTTAPSPTANDAEQVAQLFVQVQADGTALSYLTVEMSFDLPVMGQTLLFADSDNASHIDLFLQMANYFNDFGAFDGTAAANRLLQQLNTVELVAPAGERIGAGVLLQNTRAEQLRRQDQRAAQVAGQLTTPSLFLLGTAVKNYRWQLSQRQRTNILQALTALLQSRLADITGGEGRYKTRDRQYRVRGFIRVQRDDRCPPEVVWSAPTPRIQIAEWHAPGPAGVPVVQISLPDITDREQLKALKPNIAFQVPASLHNLLDANDLAGLLAGNVKSGNLALDWICSFNIPIITICAFLVLNIFLQLFQIVFWWLFYIRSCIPIPKRE